MSWTTALRKAVQNPGMAYRVACSLLRGRYYKVKFRLLGRRVIIGKWFRAEGPLDIRGPGTVVFGNNCTVSSSRRRPTAVFTHAPDAVITFGNRVLLTRTRLGCVKRIDVADNAGLAEAWIMDTDYHSVAVSDEPRYNSSGASKPVAIGANAWIGAGSFVLKGVKIGENSVVGAGAVVVFSVPENTVVFGNPARVVWRLRTGKQKTHGAERAQSANGAANRT
jgi:acetyltransferase-like isoleucine patch superfamily enzyme